MTPSTNKYANNTAKNRSDVDSFRNPRAFRDALKRVCSRNQNIRPQNSKRFSSTFTPVPGIEIILLQHSLHLPAAKMSLPTKNLQSVAPVLGAILLGWIVELFSLYYLQKSARLHNTPAWAAGAGFPAEAKPWKLYRFQWLTVWFEFVTVFLIIFSLTKANAIRRFRLAFIGLLTISAVLHIFSTNSILNLQDAKPTSTLITHTELLRARIVSGAFAFGAAFTIALILVLGEDDAKLGSGSEVDAQQSLLQPGDV